MAVSVPTATKLVVQTTTSTRQNSAKNWERNQLSFISDKSILGYSSLVWRLDFVLVIYTYSFWNFCSWLKGRQLLVRNIHWILFNSIFHVAVRLFNILVHRWRQKEEKTRSGTRTAGECVTDVFTTFWRPLWSLSLKRYFSSIPLLFCFILLVHSFFEKFSNVFSGSK